MKWSNIIYVAFLIVLSVFATLYFVKPRQVTVNIEKPIWDHIPDEILARFTPEAPDTTWHVEVEELIQRIRSLEKTLQEPSENPPRDASYINTNLLKGDSVTVSQKTFREELLGTGGIPLIGVESNIRAYSSTPVLYFENSLAIKPYKENLVKEYFSKVPKRSKFWTGVSVGAGALGGLILTGFLTGVF